MFHINFVKFFKKTYSAEDLLTGAFKLSRNKSSREAPPYKALVKFLKSMHLNKAHFLEHKAPNHMLNNEILSRPSLQVSCKGSNHILRFCLN